MNEEVPAGGSAFRLKARRASARMADRTACYTDLLTIPVLGSLPVLGILRYHKEVGVVRGIMDKRSREFAAPGGLGISHRICSRRTRERMNLIDFD